MDDYLISIIIPVYNSSKFIKKCLNSVLNQTYKNYEVIIIDDGSTDNSCDICKKIIEKDDRFFLFRQQNQGVSSARNFGLSKCKGDYIMFLDSDDTIDKNCFMECVRIANYKEPDIIKFNYLKKSKFIRKNNISSFTKNVFYEQSEYKKNIIPYLLIDYNYRNIWTSLIKKNLLEDELFDLNLNMGEDSLLFFKILSKSKSFYYLDKCLYNYMYNSTSIVHTYDIDKGLKKLNDVLYVNKFILLESKKKYGIVINNNLDIMEINNFVFKCIECSSYEKYILLRKVIELKYKDVVNINDIKHFNISKIKFTFLKSKCFIKRILLRLL